MRTANEVKYAFTPVTKLNPTQTQTLYKMGLAFQGLAEEVLDLVPESADRTAALRKLLEAKFTCSQAITHVIANAKKGPKNEETKVYAQDPEGEVDDIV